MALLALAEDVLLLAFNDATSARSPLSLATSVDGGATWQKLVMLESAPAGSFHYPTAHLVSNDTLAVIYSVDVLPHQIPSARVPDPRGPPTRTSVVSTSGTVYRQGSLNRAMLAEDRSLSPHSLLSDSLPDAEPGMALTEETRGNAWGRVSLGMRVAFASRADLVRAARAAGPRVTHPVHTPHGVSFSLNKTIGSS